MSWEAYLAEHFPGYLLPEASRRVLPADVAARFLERLGGSARQLFLLRAASVIAAHADAIAELALVHLPALCRASPAHVSAELCSRAGELRGRLDVPATVARWIEGRRAELVCRAPRRDVAPETALLAGVAARLASVLAELRAAGLTGESGWGVAMRASEEALGRALSVPPLSGAWREPIGERHARAGMAARHPGYALAARLNRALREGLDADDPALVARVVAAGALGPLADHTRFELAVLIRLIEALWARLDGAGFTLLRTLVLRGRREVAEFAGERGARVAVYYDQAPLDPGPYDAGLRRYLDQRGRLRPDITVTTSAPGRADRAAIIEAKLSDDPAYLAQGYREAHVYRAEYAGALRGWPKAILVASRSLAGPPSREDEVIAVGWDRWVPDEVVDGLLEGVL